MPYACLASDKVSFLVGSLSFISLSTSFSAILHLILGEFFTKLFVCDESYCKIQQLLISLVSNFCLLFCLELKSYICSYKVHFKKKKKKIKPLFCMAVSKEKEGSRKKVNLNEKPV